MEELDFEETTLKTKRKTPLLKLIFKKERNFVRLAIGKKSSQFENQVLSNRKFRIDLSPNVTQLFSD